MFRIAGVLLFLSTTLHAVTTSSTCPPLESLALKRTGPREEILEAFSRLGADPDEIRSLWAGAAEREIPRSLLDRASAEHWPLPDVKKLHSTMAQLGEPYGWTLDQIEQTTHFVSVEAFGKIEIEHAPSNEEDLSRIEIQPTKRNLSNDPVVVDALQQARVVFDNLEAAHGKLPPVEKLPIEKIAEFVRVPYRARMIVVLEAKKALGDEKAQYLKQILATQIPNATFAAALMVRNGKTLRSYRGYHGLIKLSDSLGISDLGRVYDIAKGGLTSEQFASLGWNRHVGHSDAARLRHMLSHLEPHDGTRTLMHQRGPQGLADFAEIYFDGDVYRAYETASFILQPAQLRDREWARPAVGTKARNLRLEDAVRRNPKRYEGTAGVVRAAIELGTSVRTAQIELRKFQPSNGPDFPSLSAAELWNATRWIADSDGSPLAVYQGRKGLDQIAHDYFLGDKKQAFATYRAALSADKFEALGWRDKYKHEPPGPIRSFQGRIMPTKLQGTSDAERMLLSPAQRKIANEYLISWIEQGEHPNRFTWSGPKLQQLFATGEYRPGRSREAQAYFPSTHAAVSAIHQVAEENGFQMNWLGRRSKTPPSESIRQAMRISATDELLGWMVRNPGNPPPLRPDGTAAGELRLFGRDVYAAGKRDYRIFDNREQADVALRKRATELGIPLAPDGRPRVLVDKEAEKRFLLNLVASEPPLPSQNLTPEQLASVRHYWTWVIAKGRFPATEDWGTGDGKLGLAQSTFYGQAKDRATTFTSKDEAILAVHDFGTPLGLRFPFLETQFHKPTTRVREILSAQAVDRYLDWYVANSRKPSHSDFGTSSLAITQSRFFGYGAYRAGEKKYDARLFDSRQQAMDAIMKRAAERGITISFSERANAPETASE